MAYEGYNGWANWETWNVALWLQNDENLYRMARRCGWRGYTYEELVPRLMEMMPNATPDGVAWDDPELDYDELNELVADL